MVSCPFLQIDYLSLVSKVKTNVIFEDVDCSLQTQTPSMCKWLTHDVVQDLVRNMSAFMVTSIHPTLDPVHSRDLDGLPPQARHTIHASHGGLLLHLVVEPDEPIAPAESSLVQNH